MITTQPRLLLRTTGLLLMFILLCCALQAAGCASVYHRAKADLPPEPDARLALRMQESRDATIAAAERAEELAAAAESSDPGASTDTDPLSLAAARARAAVIELDRRLLGVADAIAAMPAAPPDAPPATDARAAQVTHQRLTHARDLLDTALTAAAGTQLRNADTPAALRAAAARLREAAEPDRAVRP